MKSDGNGVSDHGRTTTAGRRGGSSGGQATRRAIVDAALTEFSKVGFRGTSMREIARRCGVAHGTLTYHFATKEDLLVAVLERRDEITNELLASQRAERDESGRPASGPIERMLAAARANESVTGLVRLYSMMQLEATDPDHPAHDYFTQRTANGRATAEESVREEQWRGRIRSDLDPAIVGTAVTALWDGLQLHALISPDEVNVAETISYLVSALISPELGGAASSGNERSSAEKSEGQ